ncbi:MAG TPA: DNA ligase, partial [Rhodocyclaceae bacterium]
MQRRWLLVALAGCFAGGGMAETPSAVPVADEAPATAPSILLAETFHPGVDPAACWVSEKYDGVRAVWNGRELRFRSGRRVPAPAWFTAALPREPLDGELWLGRGRFDELSGIVRRAEPNDADWRNVKYLVFELPRAAGSFTERSERLRAVAAGVEWLQPVPQFRVADRHELEARLAEVVRGGGEGLVLHRAQSLYSTGRSGDLFKLKPWRDAEAMVVGYEPGRGRLAGKVGALRLLTEDGKLFR